MPNDGNIQLGSGRWKPNASRHTRYGSDPFSDTPDCIRLSLYPRVKNNPRLGPARKIKLRRKPKVDCHNLQFQNIICGKRSSGVDWIKENVQKGIYHLCHKLQMIFQRQNGHQTLNKGAQKEFISLDAAVKGLLFLSEAPNNLLEQDSQQLKHSTLKKVVLQIRQVILHLQLPQAARRQDQFLNQYKNLLLSKEKRERFKVNISMNAILKIGAECSTAISEILQQLDDHSLHLKTQANIVRKLKVIEERQAKIDEFFSKLAELQKSKKGPKYGYPPQQLSDMSPLRRAIQFDDCFKKEEMKTMCPSLFNSRKVTRSVSKLQRREKSFNNSKHVEHFQQKSKEMAIKKAPSKKVFETSKPNFPSSSIQEQQHAIKIQIIQDAVELMSSKKVLRKESQIPRVEEDSLKELDESRISKGKHLRNSNWFTSKRSKTYSRDRVLEPSEPKVSTFYSKQQFSMNVSPNERKAQTPSELMSINDELEEKDDVRDFIRSSRSIYQKKFFIKSECRARTHGRINSMLESLAVLHRKNVSENYVRSGIKMERIPKKKEGSSKPKEDWFLLHGGLRAKYANFQKETDKTNIKVLGLQLCRELRELGMENTEEYKRIIHKIGKVEKYRNYRQLFATPSGLKKVVNANRLSIPHCEDIRQSIEPLILKMKETTGITLLGNKMRACEFKQESVVPRVTLQYWLTNKKEECQAALIHLNEKMSQRLNFQKNQVLRLIQVPL